MNRIALLGYCLLMSRVSEGHRQRVPALVESISDPDWDEAEEMIKGTLAGLLENEGKGIESIPDRIESILIAVAVVSIHRGSVEGYLCAANQSFCVLKDLYSENPTAVKEELGKYMMACHKLPFNTGSIRKPREG